MAHLHVVQVQLFDPDLGVLELGCSPYIVTSLQVGSPAVREVTRNRALSDGVIDDTAFFGERAITASLTLDSRGRRNCGREPMQALIDRLTPYMSPRRRPRLTWQLPYSEPRSAIVRGVNWGWTLNRIRANSIAPQWRVPSGEILAGGPNAVRTVRIKPSTDTEAGRTYPLEFDRTYPASLPIGGRTVFNPGTAPAHWVLTIYGPVTDPIFTINGIPFKTDRLGGVALSAGQTLVVDTAERTVLFNGTATRYQHVNYDEWGWDALMLQPRQDNTLRFDGDDLSDQSEAVLRWTPTYL